MFESFAYVTCCLKERDQLRHPSLIPIADFTIPVSVDPFRVPHAAGLTVADRCGTLCTSQKGVLRLSNLKACKIAHMPISGRHLGPLIISMPKIAPLRERRGNRCCVCSAFQCQLKRSILRLRRYPLPNRSGSRIQFTKPPIF